MKSDCAGDSLEFKFILRCDASKLRAFHFNWLCLMSSENQNWFIVSFNYSTIHPKLNEIKSQINHTKMWRAPGAIEQRKREKKAHTHTEYAARWKAIYLSLISSYTLHSTQRDRNCSFVYLLIAILNVQWNVQPELVVRAKRRMVEINKQTDENFNQLRVNKSIEWNHHAGETKHNTWRQKKEANRFKSPP